MLASCTATISGLGGDAGNLDEPLDAGAAFDSGIGALDAGPTPIDAGSMALDAGKPVRDAGIRTPPWDGGSFTDFINQMAPNSWREMAGTEMWRACPGGNSYACKAVTDAWGGGAFDSVRDRMIIFGGGHNDSYFNNVFVFDLASTTWQRASEMSAGLESSSGTGIYRDVRAETCGLYPLGPTLTVPAEWLTPSGYIHPDKCDEPSVQAQLDPQQPRSTHTYGNIAFSPATKAFYNLGNSAPYPSGQATSRRTMSFDFDTGLWSRRADNKLIAIGGASAADANGHIYYLALHAASEYDPATDTWADIAGTIDLGAYYSGAAVDTKRNRLVTTNSGTDIKTFKLGEPGKPLVSSKTTGLATGLGGTLAFEYDSKLDRYFAWAGGTSVYWLNPDTEVWATSDGSNDDPGGVPGAGCYGKLRYSATYNVYVLVRATNLPVMFYKPPTTAP